MRRIFDAHEMGGRYPKDNSEEETRALRGNITCIIDGSLGRSRDGNPAHPGWVATTCWRLSIPTGDDSGLGYYLMIRIKSLRYIII